MVDWATVAASVLLSVAGSIVVTEYQLQRESSIEESEEIENWSNFRRGLRKRRQGAFDEVTRQMRQTDQAGGMQNPIEPRWTMILSLAISYERRISELEETIEKLEASVEEEHAEQAAEKTFS